jgi:cysteine desulfurase
VQAAGRIACGFDALPADALALSGHKIGAPKGSGALVLRDPAANIESMQIRGGGQERGARAGPENAAGRAAFGAAAMLPRPRPRRPSSTSSSRRPARTRST